jgi:hypothetical protein
MTMLELVLLLTIKDVEEEIVLELLKALLVLLTIKDMEEKIALKLLKSLLVLLVLLLLFPQSIAWKRHSVCLLKIVCKHTKALSMTPQEMMQ